MLRWAIGATMLLSVASPSWAWMKLNKDGQCGFGQSFDGPGETQFIVKQSKEEFDRDEVVVIVVNSNWSIAEGDAIGRITIDSDDYSFWDDSPVAFKNGFGLRMPSEHIDAFSAKIPSSVSILKDKQKIDALDFSGFYSEWLGFENCRRPWKTEKADRERRENIEKTLPRDPFAK